MSQIGLRRRTNALMNEKFIDIRTYSCHRSCVADPAGEHFNYPRTVDDSVLGEAVAKALQSSRFLTPAEAESLRANASTNYDGWVQSMMELHGYKNKARLFKNMLQCTVEAVGDLITIKPTRHERLEGWSGDGISEEDYVVVPIDASADSIGHALREALSRCS